MFALMGWSEAWLWLGRLEARPAGVATGWRRDGYGGATGEIGLVTSLFSPGRQEDENEKPEKLGRLLSFSRVVTRSWKS